MKKLLLCFALAFLLGANNSTAQIKYVESMYTRASVNRTQNLIYQANIGVLTGSPKLDTLRFDLYTPSGNTDTKRPLVIFLHTGSFLPRYINQTPTGARDDSATVEFCYQMAQRGYVVASVSYRLGWNPYATTEDGRKASIINAAYKSVQDVATAVRYFKKSVLNANPYGIDSMKIAIGGQGTGSYAMYAYGAVTSQPEIKIDKFYDFTLDAPMVNDSIWGDRRSFKIPGSNPPNLFVENHKEHTSNAQIGFAIGGAMGDSSWIEAGEMPMISVHPILDPFAPYKTGMVYVPGTNLAVVEVSGGYDVIKIANKKGNNDCYAAKSKDFKDPYTMRANSLNDGIEGLFPVAGAANSSGPWEWWDSAYIRAYLTASGMFTQAQITTINVNGSLTNPLMSKTRALKFIDSTLGYIMPRVALCLGVWDGVGAPYGTKQFNPAAFVSISPNPTTGMVHISNGQNANALQTVHIRDINGRLLSSHSVSGNSIDLNLNLVGGVYLVQMQFAQGTGTKQLVVR
jgi:hypothetical protein